MLSSEVVILQNVVLVQCDVTMQSNRCQLCTICSKVNFETIPTKGPYHEWINGMVIGQTLSNWGRYEFLGGDGQKLSLAAMPVIWRGRGWFGVKFWTPTLTKIPLESSLQRLSIGAIKHGGSTVKWYDTNFIRYKIALLAIVFGSAQTRQYPDVPVRKTSVGWISFSLWGRMDITGVFIIV